MHRIFFGFSTAEAAPTAPAIFAKAVPWFKGPPGLRRQFARPFESTAEKLLLFHEAWEGTGTEEVWSGSLVDGGNTLDDDYDTGGVGSPPWWGGQAMQCIIAAAFTNAFRFKDFGYNLPVAYISFDVVIQADALASDGQAFALFDGFDDSAAVDGDRVLRVIFQRVTSTTRRFVLQDWRDDTENSSLLALEALYEEDKPFRMQLCWDKINAKVSIAIDNQILVNGATISSARGGLRYFRLGCQGMPVTATAVFDNFIIRTDAWATPLLARDAPTEVAIWAEHCESNEWDMPWSEVETDLSAGNSIDGNANPSAILAPPSWGAAAAKCVIGGTGPGAINRHKHGGPITTTLFISGEWYLEADASANGTEANILFAKKDHLAGENIGSIELFKDSGGARQFRALLADAGKIVTFYPGPTLGRFYKIEWKIDFVNNFYEIWVDGQPRAAGAWLTAWYQEANWFMMGKSAGSAALNMTFWMDNFLVASNGWATDTAQAPSRQTKQTYQAVKLAATF
jgi:hypothetical protein